MRGGLLLGLLGLAGLLPLIVFGLYGGAVADAVDRRTLVLGSTVGQVVLTQSVAPPRGEVPWGFRSAPRRSGRVTGSWSSGTATSPCSGQCTIGIGGPQ